MKKIYRYILLAILGITLVSCSDEDGVNDPGNEVYAYDYYPGTPGSTYSYRVDTLNANYNDYDRAGARNMEITGREKLGGTDYFIQENEVILAEGTTNTTTNFRRTSGGVYFRIDTTGFSAFYDSLPDSIKNEISFDVDDEIIAVSTPLDNGKVWSAYRLNLVYNLFNINYSIIEVSAKYSGSEQMEIQAFPQGVKTEKIDYTLTLRIPTSENLSETEVRNFYAGVWYTEGVGQVKFEGNSVIWSAITGGVIDLADTSRTYREELTDYNFVEE